VLHKTVQFGGGMASGFWFGTLPQPISANAAKTPTRTTLDIHASEK
jgi:hypothetical protein